VEIIVPTADEYFSKNKIKYTHYIDNAFVKRKFEEEFIEEFIKEFTITIDAIYAILYHFKK
jgi:hypothetical protein